MNGCLSASFAVILLSGSRANILSNKSASAATSALSSEDGEAFELEDVAAAARRAATSASALGLGTTVRIGRPEIGSSRIAANAYCSLPPPPPAPPLLRLPLPLPRGRARSASRRRRPA